MLLKLGIDAPLVILIVAVSLWSLLFTVLWAIVESLASLLVVVKTSVERAP